MFYIIILYRNSLLGRYMIKRTSISYSSISYLLMIFPQSSTINCQFLLFADDLKMYTHVFSNDNCSILQNELNVLFGWCQKWGMSLNISKCCSMSFYSSRSPLKFVYSINNNFIESVSHIKDLGKYNVFV